MRRDKIAGRLKRKMSIRKRIFGTELKPRLTVFRSNLHIYAQIIDDVSGKTLVSANSNTTEVKETLKNTPDINGKIGVASIVGEVLGRKALEAKVECVVFDRNGYLYHGRVKALADGARKSGLKF